MKTLLLFIFSFIFLLPLQSQTENKNTGETYGVTFSFPWLNYYRYVDYHTNDLNKKFGFFGLGISGYYKRNEHKISFNCSTTEDLSSPVARINYTKKDIITSIGSSFFELIYQHPIHDNFSIVAGFNFTNYNFHLESNIDTLSSYTKVDQTLGLSAGLEYCFNKYYSVATIYRPSLASFETDMKYRHLITVELKINLDIWTKKQAL